MIFQHILKLLCITYYTQNPQKQEPLRVVSLLSVYICCVLYRLYFSQTEFYFKYFFTLLYYLYFYIDIQNRIDKSTCLYSKPASSSAICAVARMVPYNKPNLYACRKVEDTTKPSARFETGGTRRYAAFSTL